MAVIRFDDYLGKENQNEIKLRNISLDEYVKNLKRRIITHNMPDDTTIIADELVYYAHAYKNPFRPVPNPEEWESPATPIITILNAFKIFIYKCTNMTKSISGVLFTGGKTKEHYKHKTVVFIDGYDTTREHRAILAYELANYLFDYLYNRELVYKTESYAYECPDFLFKKTVTRGKATDFAMALMMPRITFVDKYKEAWENSVYANKYLSDYYQMPEICIKYRAEQLELTKKI